MAREIDQTQWMNAYLTEINRTAELLPDRVLNTVYFGGGTPSLMQPDIVAAILQRISQCWPQANDLEVTLEANPGSVEAGRFAGYSQAGVSRISMGFQALNDTDLRRLGRIHTVAEARKAYDIARRYFDRVSFDLIYARQDQTLNDWQAELREAVDMAADHLSLYQLTVENGTAFGDRYAKGGLRGLPGDDLSADMYLVTQEICDAAGLPAYEVSNHARPGAESRHNLIYWRYGDYIGIGPGAHGRITKDRRRATVAWSSPERWLRAVDQGSGDKSSEALAAHDQANEYLMMGLRIRGGIDRARFEALAGRALPEEVLTHLHEIGMIQPPGPRIEATDQGRMVLNSVIKELLLD